MAYLLADENGVSIKVAKYAGKDKVDLIENEEYGYCSLTKATNQVLEKLKIENSTRAKVTSTKRIERNLVEPSCSSMPRNHELMRVFKDVGWSNSLAPA